MTLRDYADEAHVDCCGNCRFAELSLIDQKSQMIGVSCRRYPPMMMMVNGQGVNMVPNCWAHGWCGEHQRGTVHVGRGDFFGAHVREDNGAVKPVSESHH